MTLMDACCIRIGINVRNLAMQIGGVNHSVCAKTCKTRHAVNAGFSGLAVSNCFTLLCWNILVWVMGPDLNHACPRCCCSRPGFWVGFHHLLHSMCGVSACPRSVLECCGNWIETHHFCIKKNCVETLDEELSFPGLGHV